MRIKRAEALETVGFSMTPMIDIVFQLIIFFMLATDFSQLQFSELTLPDAMSAVDDSKPDPDRLHVNLMHKTQDCDASQCRNRDHWRLVVNQREYGYDQIKVMLRNFGDRDRDPVTMTSNLPVMLWADKGAPYSEMERFMMACAQAKIVKLELGTRKPQGSSAN
jgi:biopolymer transport protein ExbD